MARQPFTGGLKDPKLVRVRLENGKVVGRGAPARRARQRVRDVREGPGGVLYVVTDEANGELWKIAPR